MPYFHVSILQTWHLEHPPSIEFSSNISISNVKLALRIESSTLASTGGHKDVDAEFEGTGAFCRSRPGREGVLVVACVASPREVRRRNAHRVFPEGSSPKIFPRIFVCPSSRSAHARGAGLPRPAPPRPSTRGTVFVLLARRGRCARSSSWGEERTRRGAGTSEAALMGMRWPRTRDPPSPPATLPADFCPHQLLSVIVPASFDCLRCRHGLIRKRGNASSIGMDIGHECAYAIVV